MSIGIFKVSYLDACAAVKLVIPELGSDRLNTYFANQTFHITGFCLFEALGVLKRKMCRKEIPQEQYFKACYMLIAYLQGKRIRIDDEPKIESIETFMRGQALAKKHGRATVGYRKTRQILQVGEGIKDYPRYVRPVACESRTSRRSAGLELRKGVETA